MSYNKNIYNVVEGLYNETFVEKKTFSNEMTEIINEELKKSYQQYKDYMNKKP